MHYFLPPAALAHTPEAARWVAEEEWHPGVKSEPQVGGGVILRIPYKYAAELVMDVLRHGTNVEVLSPEGCGKPWRRP